MKKICLILSCLIVIGILTSSTATAQNGCIILRDSVIASDNNDAGNYTDYTYNSSNLVIKAAVIDSGGTNSYRYDTIYYNGSNQVSKTETYYYNFPNFVLDKSIIYNYNGSGQVIRLDESGNSNGNPYTVSYDVSYNSGNIRSIIVDPTSITGSPDALSFIDIMWQGGNISTLSLLFGSDTIELIPTFDTKNNVLRKLPNLEGASGLFQITPVNNIIQIVLANNEPAVGAPAGTQAVSRSYTYNGNNDVATRTDLPGLFEQNTRTTQFFYDCSVGISAAALPSPVQKLEVYPNPANDVITVKSELMGTLKLYDLNGKEIKRQLISTPLSTLNVSDLNPGFYFVEIQSEKQIHKSNMFRKD